MYVRNKVTIAGSLKQVIFKKGENIQDMRESCNAICWRKRADNTPTKNMLERAGTKVLPITG